MSSFVESAFGLACIAIFFLMPFGLALLFHLQSKKP